MDRRLLQKALEFFEKKVRIKKGFRQRVKMRNGAFRKSKAEGAGSHFA